MTTRTPGTHAPLNSFLGPLIVSAPKTFQGVSGTRLRESGTYLQGRKVDGSGGPLRPGGSGTTQVRSVAGGVWRDGRRDVSRRPWGGPDPRSGGFRRTGLSSRTVVAPQWTPVPVPGGSGRDGPFEVSVRNSTRIRSERGAWVHRTLRDRRSRDQGLEGTVQDRGVGEDRNKGLET